MPGWWTRPAGSLAGRALRKLLGNLPTLMLDQPRAANRLVGQCARTTLSISARNIRSRVKKVTFVLEKSLRVHAPLEKPAAMGQVEQLRAGRQGRPAGGAGNDLWHCCTWLGPVAVAS